ncbi:MAG TPA: helix-hairpin-helix domain-containing protein [Bacteroidales bacterium]|nr:helix-hairpin-helix domain-containing protein [Bacteroidales bacterium]
MKSKFVKEYFNFSKRERNGLIVLLSILAIIIITRIIIVNISDNNKKNFNEFENEIDLFLSYSMPDLENGERFYFDPNTATKEDFLRMGLCVKTVNSIIAYRDKGWKFYKAEDLEKVYEITPEEFAAIKDYINIESKSYKNTNNFYDKKTQKETKLFQFDPNLATKEEFLSLGFKPWQADNIIKFRDKGGVFKSFDDLANIYGLDQEHVEKLKPYVVISDKFKNYTPPTKKDPNIILDLNSATETDLQKISGIGPSYAKRIVEYKTRLGGFINVVQLKEVYGMTEELYSSIYGNFTINTDNTKKININTAEYFDLVSHPYISKENAKNILNYRNFAGKIKSTDELIKQKAVDKEFYDKILPYICTE